MVRPGGLRGAVGRFAGLQRCGSVWSCPECARHLAAARVEVITRAMETAQGAGYGACWITLTLPHRAPDALGETLGLVTRAWREISASREWKALKRSLGVLGLFRKVEVTHGENGWHPHAHVTFLTAAPLSEGDLFLLEDCVYRHWAEIVTAAGFEPPRRDLCPLDVVDLHRMDSATWAQYVGKMLGLEFAGTGKESRAKGGRTPFEILDGAVALAKGLRGNRAAIAEAGDPRLGPYACPDARLWAEYQRETRGKHQMHWSRGLKALLGVTGEGADGEQMELADGVLGPEEETVYSFTLTEWHELRKEPARLSALLAIAESPAPLRDRVREVRLWLAHWCGVSYSELLPV